MTSNIKEYDLDLVLIYVHKMFSLFKIYGGKRGLLRLTSSCDVASCGQPEIAY